MTWISRGLGIGLAVAATVGLMWGSVVPMATQAAPDAVLRLAWSARPERVEICREQTAEELARLPAHMRQPLVCEGTTASYRLEVRYNGDLIAEQIVRGGGLRRDRRLYVFRELPVPAGQADIAVRMDRIEASDSAAAAAPGQPDRSATTSAEDAATGRRSDGPASDRRGDAAPAHLSLTQRLYVSPREVILVTYDADRRELTAIQRARN
jgi:hypothetical protein